MSVKYYNQILTKKASLTLLKRLGAGFGGEIKAVVDIKREVVAAGAEWHAESRDMLVKNGSDAEDLWGARVNIKTGHIVYKSQINEGRMGAQGNEIVDQEIRSDVETLIRRYLV